MLVSNHLTLIFKYEFQKIKLILNVLRLSRMFSKLCFSLEIFLNRKNRSYLISYRFPGFPIFFNILNVFRYRLQNLFLNACMFIKKLFHIERNLYQGKEKNT